MLLEEQHNDIEVKSTTDIPIEPVPVINDDDTVKTGRPKKGRKRKYPQSRDERKRNKYNNIEYTTTKNEIIKPKVFVDYRCKCLKKCADLIPVEVRKQEFEKFVKLGSFNAQVLYIISCVTEYNKKRSYTMCNVPGARKKPRQFYRVYKIKDVQVCRDMFLKTFQITTQKVTVSLKKRRSGEPIVDGRGIHRGDINKLTDEDHKFIVDIINNLPKYESHYRRNNNSGTLYLRPGMTINKIYDIYTKEHAEMYGIDRKCASFATLKKIFYADFNLKCKKLKKDTCNKCDQLFNQISNAKTEQEQEDAKTERLKHLERAEMLRNQMNQDFIDARNIPDVECLTFDLEKTLPLPRIPTNVAFYKRQLWLYNSGIHSASDDVGHCYVWVEGEAGRGAQEVGSCLVKYIKTKLQPSVKNLILWSDCCGGQNRNIKIVLLLKTVLSCCHSTLESITFRFLESGHTFLPNDTDFSKIETALKHHQRIYTAEEYIDIFKNAKKKKPLQVQRMEKADFYGTEKIEKNIMNRKKFSDKSKVSWLNAKEIKIEKNKLYSIFMRTSFEEEFKELLIDKKNREIKKDDLILLWPNGKPIAPAKLADLESMYMFIPEDCVQFYKNLKSSDKFIDDFDGFGGEPDFEIIDE
ncbi:jg19649 [Pararge aegeria aegeria]|uniref:Jg19649 protein n=4 Tax=Pararge aegeria TaxID=116150 RepID=A0A8S4QVE4_9NEOP|nr:jg19649 [Pararge aegeria aegeria]